MLSEPAAPPAGSDILGRPAPRIGLPPPPKRSIHRASGRAGPVGGAPPCAFRKAWWSGNRSFQASTRTSERKEGRALAYQTSVLSETAGARFPKHRVPGLIDEACIDG